MVLVHLLTHLIDNTAMIHEMDVANANAHSNSNEDSGSVVLHDRTDCNIPWLSIHGLLRDLPGTVEIVLSCLSSVQ
jgi:hypothetical protein